MFSFLAFALSVNVAFSVSAKSNLPTLPRPLSAFGVKGHSSTLTIRGGASTDQVINAVGYILFFTGIQGWLAPQSTLEAYGAEHVTEEDKSFVRILSSMNGVAGATLLASESAATSVCFTGWTLATMANTPAIENLSVKKGPFIGTIAVFGILSELHRQGKISSSLALKILSVLLIGSVVEIVNPKPILESFGVSLPTPLIKSLFRNFSFTKLSIGLYLLVGELTGKRGLGFSAAMAASVVNILKTITIKEEVGVKLPGLIVWAVLLTAAGTFTYTQAQ